EQLLLEADLVTGVTGEGARRPDDAVAGDHDRKRIPSQRLGDGPHRGGLAELAGETGVRRHRAIRNFRGRREHVSVELAASETKIEGPFESGALAFEVLHQLPVPRLDLGAVLDGLDTRRAGQARASDARVWAEVFDERDTLFGLRDEDLAQRGGEDAVGDGAPTKVLQACLEALSRSAGRRDRRGNSSDGVDDAVDRSVLSVLVGARRAAADVALDAVVGGGIGVTGGAGDEVELDSGARVRSIHR